MRAHTHNSITNLQTESSAFGFVVGCCLSTNHMTDRLSIYIFAVFRIYDVLGAFVEVAAIVHLCICLMF